MRALIALVIIQLACALSAFGETGSQTETGETKKYYLYQWTDAKGGVHINDNLGDVPEQYRANARKIEMPKGQESGPEQHIEGETEYHPETGTEEQETASKAAWQNRLRGWKERLAAAREEYRSLEQKRAEALGKWGGAASGHLEGRAEAERIEQQMKAVQQEIDEARDMVETVIPDQARKAGIPPGWLRE